MSDEPRKPIEFPGSRPAPLDKGPEQVFFDTVTGPNLRWRDNLIQLGMIAAGTVLGGGAGLIYAVAQSIEYRLGPTLVGGFAGMVVALLLSGTILGLVRGYRAMKN